MPNTKETVRALTRAFNVNNYCFDTAETNFTVKSRNGKDCIIVLFDRGMDSGQCKEYLQDLEKKIIREFYGIKISEHETILSLAEMIFDVESFPFNTSKGNWSIDAQDRIELAVPIDQGVIFNLKSHLAFLLKKDIQANMSVYITTKPFDREKYLWCGEFSNAKLRKQFESQFLSRMKERYKNVPKDLLKVKGNDVYIRNTFDDVRFIDSTVQYNAWLIGIDLGVSNGVDYKVKSFKDMIIGSIYQSTRMIINGFVCASPLGRKEASVLVPVVQNCKGMRFITKEEARIINDAFDNTILNDVSGRTQAELSVNGNNAIYGIDFFNPEISYRIITKIIENSVINKDHELSIDPELPFRSMSPVRSPGGVSNAECNGEIPGLFLKSPDSSEPPRPPHQVFPGCSSRHK